MRGSGPGHVWSQIAHVHEWGAPQVCVHRYREGLNMARTLQRPVDFCLWCHRAVLLFKMHYIILLPFNSVSAVISQVQEIRPFSTILLY